MPILKIRSKNVANQIKRMCTKIHNSVIYLDTSSRDDNELHNEALVKRVARLTSNP